MWDENGQQIFGDHDADESRDYYEGGDHEEKHAGGFCGAIGICCLGFLLFPVCLYLNGWNEKQNVCDQGTIEWVGDRLSTTSCKFSGEKDYAFFSCPIQPLTGPAVLDVFKTLNRQANAGDGLTGYITSTAPSISQNVEVLQCIPHTKTTGSGNDKKTTTTYTVEWSSDFVSTPAGKCGPSSVANVWPGNLERGTQTHYANELTVGDYQVPGPLFSDALPPATPIRFNSSDPNFGKAGALYTPGSFVALKSLWPSSGYLYACTDPNVQVAPANIGCARITLSQNTATSASVIGKIASSKEVDEITIPSTWLCSASAYSRFTAGTTTQSKAVADALAEVGARTWVLRIFVVLGACGAIFCCLYPLMAAVECVGYFIEFIPCCGECISTLMESVACCFNTVISCCCGTSISLLVMGIMWVAVRPKVAIPLLVVGILLSIGGAVLAYFMRKKKEDKGALAYDDEQPWE